MSNNITFQDSDLSTPPNATVVETIDQGAGVQRQRVEVASFGTTAAGTALTAVVSGAVTLATGAATIGAISNTSFIATQATAANLNATVTLAAGAATAGTVIAVQPTAANLNTTTVLAAGSATAGTVIAVQPTAANLNTTTVLAAGSATAGTMIIVQATGANLNVTPPLKNYLWYSGATANTGGLIANTTVNLMTTELNAITNVGVIVSSVTGTSGLLTNGLTGQGVWCEIFYKNGTQPATAAAGGSITGWFLQTPDAGTTVESKTLAAARPPDFLIPITATAATAQVYKAAGPVRLPALQFYVLIQNNIGVTMSTSANSIIAAPIAVQY